ncbi:bifunctional 4-hydroxy-2-oxoglutarate aldolase/2-dehydro-3-deoxy-phosphogluconate aldolase [Aerococcaceae bacterium DSM 111176]|nr:bifunctional 4-hydroxy-2-oxoglutarate aldolase/2-dehydro-3-deoxy-phosphogluconate aldolase [Aerococcaceae bacterium DSM 111176]
MTTNYLEQLRKERLLPLYTTTDMSLVAKAEEILVNNGLSFIEVTYRSEHAGSTIKQLSESGKLIVGAGTVTDIETAKDAIDNGATFIVMPGFSAEVVQYCQERDVPVYPGVATPTEIIAARNEGLDTIKFFPADVYGGLKAIKALSGPFYDLSFIPTGGVNADNFLDFLEVDAIVAVGGSFILSESVIAKDNGETANKQLADLVAKLK